MNSFTGPCWFFFLNCSVHWNWVRQYSISVSKNSRGNSCEDDQVHIYQGQCGIVDIIESQHVSARIFKFIISFDLLALHNLEWDSAIQTAILDSDYWLPFFFKVEVVVTMDMLIRKHSVYVTVDVHAQHNNFAFPALMLQFETRGIFPLSSIPIFYHV